MRSVRVKILLLNYILRLFFSLVLVQSCQKLQNSLYYCFYLLLIERILFEKLPFRVLDFSVYIYTYTSVSCQKKQDHMIFKFSWFSNYIPVDFWRVWYFYCRLTYFMAIVMEPKRKVDQPAIFFLFILAYVVLREDAY